MLVVKLPDSIVFNLQNVRPIKFVETPWYRVSIPHKHHVSWASGPTVLSLLFFLFFP